MLKALAPITALLLAWVAAFAKPTTSKLVNIIFIALGVLPATLNEAQFAWMGLSSQTLAIVAESTHLVMLQWYLTAYQDSTQQLAAHETNAEDEIGLIISSNSSDHESDNGNSGGPVEYHSDGDDDGWSGLPIHGGHGAPETSHDDQLGDRGVFGATQISPLSLLYYYAPIWAFLNGLMALVFEGPEFDWNDLNRRLASMDDSGVEDHDKMGESQSNGVDHGDHGDHAFD
ncbi:DUF250 domain membrane protein [Diaporthe helianthi]|uniref:DUF250 domain membrane protein n=1 Tax=Diaporthe helianthi TaxID=158607 RepID=A0A2P5HFK3_DIAHE|nr:DUF250 domain membrane protein [Diaporthe helianthi]